MPYAARDIFHTDQTGLGYLVASVAIGAFIGSIGMWWGDLMSALREYVASRAT